MKNTKKRKTVWKKILLIFGIVIAIVTIAQEGYNILTPDMRAHGRKKGKFVQNKDKIYK